MAVPLGNPGSIRNTSMLSSFARQIGRFRRDRRGNIVTVFALTLVPILAAVGGAVDYSQAIRMKTKLQSAADAASVRSVSFKSSCFLAAQAITGDSPVPPRATNPPHTFYTNLI